MLKSVDTRGIVQMRTPCIELLMGFIINVGSNNVVQFTTDNEASYKVYGRELTEKYGNFYWTSHASHCID